MAGGSIADVSTGAAQAIGRYFSVVSVIPSTLYISFVYLLVASGSWRHTPNWAHAFHSFLHIGISGVGLLVFVGIALGIALHPLQFSIVQFFEGYWGIRSRAQSVRLRRIAHYQGIFLDLDSKQVEASEKLSKIPLRNEEDLDPRRPHISLAEEASRLLGNFPQVTEQVMPTRLGNVLRRYETQAGAQYGLDALQVVPHLMLTAPDHHVAYVNDQRSQLDLAVRMAFMSIIACATALLFLWPHGFWVLIAIIPYGTAYLSYRGAVVAAGHYGSAFDTLINLDRFSMYDQMGLPLPDGTGQERITNKKLMALLRYDNTQILAYRPPAQGTNDSA